MAHVNKAGLLRLSHSLVAASGSITAEGLKPAQANKYTKLLLKTAEQPSPLRQAGEGSLAAISQGADH